MLAMHRPTKLAWLAAASSAAFLLYLFLPASFQQLPALVLQPRPRSACSPTAYSSGNWSPKAVVPTIPRMTKPSDAVTFGGFQGCASDREFAWHLGADNEDMWDRFPAVNSWEWSPNDGCDVRPMDPELIVKDLVEQGGWLLIGDSVTENHFFSLSCLLYPHVRATPNYTENPYIDRAWPQHLFLSPSSPLLPHLSLPPAFNISSTPLVTFRRVDLLFTQPQLESIYAQLHPEKAREPGFSLFSEEATWTLPPAEYLGMLASRENATRYRTALVSTGGHWTTSLFSGLAEEDAEGGGIWNVMELFQTAMSVWAEDVQIALDEMNGNRYGSGARWQGGAPFQVVARAYLPGHEDCHEEKAPWTEWHPYKWNWYNWPWIKDLNEVFEGVLADTRFPDVHFLPIDTPAALRPDAHATGDCLHIMTGAGVLEGWSHYIWHYLTRELPGRVR